MKADWNPLIGLRRYLNRESGRRLLDFGRFVLARFQHAEIPQVAASLTFTTLLSLVPLITVMLSVVTAFPVFATIRAAFEGFIFAYLLPEAAAQVISVYLTQFAQSAGQLTSFGLLVVTLTALMLMHTIEMTFNRVWNVQQLRPLGQRVFIYWAVLTIGPLLTGVSLSLSSWLQRMSLIHSTWTGSGQILLNLTPLVLTIAALVLLYAMVANRYVPWQHALVGGVFAGIILELSKRGFGLYLLYFPNYRLIYGAFAAIPIFLIWIYLSWLIVLAGAVLTAALSQWQGGIWRMQPQPGQRFFYALHLLSLIQQAGLNGRPLSLRHLRPQVPLPVDQIEEILQTLARRRILVHARAGWAVLRPLETVTVAELYHTFGVAPLPPASLLARTAPWLAGVSQDQEAALTDWLRQPLTSLLPPADRPASP